MAENDSTRRTPVTINLEPDLKEWCERYAAQISLDPATFYRLLIARARNEVKTTGGLAITFDSVRPQVADPGPMLDTIKSEAKSDGRAKSPSEQVDSGNRKTGKRRRGGSGGQNR
jgi:hypothetical protein